MSRVYRARVIGCAAAAASVKKTSFFASLPAGNLVNGQCDGGWPPHWLFSYRSKPAHARTRSRSSRVGLSPARRALWRLRPLIIDTDSYPILPAANWHARASHLTPTWELTVSVGLLICMFLLAPPNTAIYITFSLSSFSLLSVTIQ